MAGRQQEIELKLGLVDPSRLGALLSVLPAPSRVDRQQNHYLDDSAGRLRALRVMARLRDSRSDGGERAVILTIKRRTAANAGVFVAEEIEQTVPAEGWPDEMPSQIDLAGHHGPVIDWLADNVDVTVLTVFGSMRNTRSVVEADGFVLEVDRTEFPDGSVDAEVEVETDRPEQARAVVQRYAAEARVALFEQTLGKYARFLQRSG